MKYFVFSLDDGTTYDREVINLFNKYGIRATFNLNSGMNNYTWYLEGHPITRFNLPDVVDLYKGHEVASHTLSHPYLDSRSEEEVIYEVNQDIKNLEEIFGREVTSFATPFHSSGEREVNLIRYSTKVTNVRWSNLDESFNMPKDPYHIYPTAFKINRALELVNDFLNRDEGVFIYAGHSYDFFAPNYQFDKLEELLKIITRHDVSIITMKELENIINDK